MMPKLPGGRREGRKAGREKRSNVGVKTGKKGQKEQAVTGDTLTAASASVQTWIECWIHVSTPMCSTQDRSF